MRIESNQTSYFEPFKSSIPASYKDEFIDLKFGYEKSPNIADKPARVFDFRNATEELLTQGEYYSTGSKKLIDAFQDLNYNHFIGLIYSYPR